MDEQAPLAVRDAALRGADAAAAVDHRALGPDRARLRRDRPDEGNFEFEGRGATPFSNVDWIVSPMQLSSMVAARPPCTVPTGLRWMSFGVAVTTTHPLSASVMS